MPDMNMMNNRPHPEDNEAAMARADLYKMANYSFKLFKMIKDGDQLEGWVQAKITKAADYVASVYHYLEYEMKFSEYGSKIENADMYTEEIRQQFKEKLTEARIKLEKLKRKNEKELEEDLKKVGDTAKTHKGGTVTKTATGIKHEKGDYDDEDHSEPAQKKPSKAAKSAAEKKGDREADKAQTKASKDWQKRFGKDSVTKVEAGKKVKEATMVPSPPDGATAPPKKDPKTGRYPKVTSGPNKGKEWSPNTPGPTNPAMKEATKAKKDYDGDGKVESPKDEVWGSRMKAAKKAGKMDEASDKCNHTPKGKSCPVHGLKECGSMYEGSTGDYSAKKAAAGKDIGKPGKNFAKIAAKAEKGGAKSGAAVAGAVLKKLRAKG